MGNMRTRADPVIGDLAEIIREWPFHRGQELAGGLQGIMGKVFPVSRQGGVVPESARSPKTGREIGPIVGEVLGIDLPLQSRTTPKEEEGEIGIPQSSYRIWNFTMEGNHGETSTLNFVATGR